VERPQGPACDIGAYELEVEVEDTTPPTVTLTSPLDQGRLNKTEDVTAEFSEEVQNVSPETFFLERKIAVKKSPPKYVLIDATVRKLNPNDPDDLSWVLDPVQDLPKGEYRATITTDVTDMADNALQEPEVWTFKVEK
jgi:Bacterial Ig-like domain